MGNRFSLLTNARRVNSEYLVYDIHRSGRARLSGETYTFATTDDVKMIKSLERIFRGELVYRDSAGIGMMADAVIGSESTVKKKMVASVRKNQRRARGKRSSQRNRVVYFDFGI